MATDKQLKFTMVVDQNSVQLVQNAVKKMIEDFDKLTASIQRASQAMGGLMGGGKAGAPAGTAAQTIGSSSYHPSVTPGTQSSTGVPGQGGINMTDALRGQQQALRDTATAAQTSMQSMVDRISQAVRIVTPQITSLTSQINNMNFAMGRGPGGGGSSGGFAGGMLPGGGAGGPPNVSNPAPAGGGGGFGSAALGVMGTAGIIAGIGAAVFTAVKAGLEFNKSSKFLGMDLASERMAISGGDLSAAYGGDSSFLLARNRAIQNYGKLHTWAGTSNSAILSGGVISAGAKGAYNNAGTFFGNLFSGNFHGAGFDYGLAEKPSNEAMEISRQQDQRAVENKWRTGMGLVETTQYNAFWSNIGERKAAERLMGRSIYKDRYGLHDAYGDLNANMLERTGFTGMEFLTGQHAQGQFAGMRGGARTSIAAQAASGYGIQGAGLLTGMSAAASPGGKGIGDFARTVFGHQGMDIFAAGNIGAALAGGMMQSGIAFNASSTLALAAGSGLLNGGAGDILGAKNFMSGQELAGAVAGGKIDGFSKGISYLSATRAMGPGAAASAIDYMATKFGTATGLARARAIIKGDAQLSPEERAGGITVPKLAAFMGEQTKNIIDRFHSSGTNQDVDVITDYAQKHGLKDAMGKFGKSRTTAALGMALTQMPGVELGTATGLAHTLTGAQVPKMKQAGAPGAFRGEHVIADDAARTAQIRQITAGVLANEGDIDLRGDWKTIRAKAPDAAKEAADKAAKEGTTALDFAATGLTKFTDALNKATLALQNIHGGSPDAPK